MSHTGADLLDALHGLWLQGTLRPQIIFRAEMMEGKNARQYSLRCDIISLSVSTGSGLGFDSRWGERGPLIPTPLSGT